MAIQLDDWLDLMREEYLAGFVGQGGSAVRFVVGEPARKAEAAARLRDIAEEYHLTVTEIDTADSKLHLMQNLFFALSRAVDWDALTQAQLERLVADCSYQWPSPGQRVSLAALAQSNGVAPGLLRKQLSQSITGTIWQDARLAQDFRHAMITLLDRRLADDRDPLAGAVTDWLRGTLSRIGQVKDAQITAKIGRHNARAMLRSLCHWLRLCGGTGQLLLIDISRLLRERREVAEGLTYTPAAVMDCYEVLRQMIDDSDELEGLFVAVLADPAFLSDDPRRSLSQYTALKMRVWDDVRPRQADNPLSPLVQLR